MKIYILLNRSTNHFIKKVYSTKYKQPNFILFLSPSPFTGAAGRIFLCNYGNGTRIPNTWV